MTRILDLDGHIEYSAGAQNLGDVPANKIQLSAAEMSGVREGKPIKGFVLADVDGTSWPYSYHAFPLGGTHVDGAVLVAMLFGPPHPSGRRMLSRLIEVVVGVLLFVALAATILAYNFVEPIRGMERVARQISRGDLSVRMHSRRSDELGSLADAFDRMSDALQTSIAGRMKMMADISHEVNTPLAAIRVNAEAVLDGVADSKVETNALMTSIVRQTKRISLLVDDLSELAKFEAGQIRMSMSAFHVVGPVRSVVEATSMVAQRNGAEISACLEDENLQAVGDASRITQVLQNLVNNAIQHNAGKVHVKISVTRDGACALFVVEDDGVGIPQDEQGNVFNRFHKLDPSRERREAGSGLGLAIVKEIVECHGSTIQVASVYGKTAFFFRLPLASV